jgi:hypothetical protein
MGIIRKHAYEPTMPKFLITYEWGNMEIWAKADDGYEADMTACLLSKQIKGQCCVYDEGTLRAVYNNGLLTIGRPHMEKPV